uniref:Uncharacterized protein n=1 Tax=Glossina morsitans morsitans TaxID=37546 RepID=A0A1B0G0Z2_GLOMM
MLETVLSLNLRFVCCLFIFVEGAFGAHGTLSNHFTHDAEFVNNTSIDKLTMPVHAKIHVIESKKKTRVSSTKSNGVEVIRNDRSESSLRQNSDNNLEEEFNKSSKNFVVKVDNETVENLQDTSTTRSTERKAFDASNLFPGKKPAGDIQVKGDQLNPSLKQQTFSPPSTPSYNPRNIKQLLTKQLYIGKLGL